MEIFWRLRGEGVSYPVAAERAGIAHSTGRGAVLAAGGVRSRPPWRMSGRFLSFAEREEIAVGLAGGLSPAVIARGLGRHRSTITREIARHRRAHGQAGLPGLAGAVAR